MYAYTCNYLEVLRNDIQYLNIFSNALTIPLNAQNFPFGTRIASYGKSDNAVEISDPENP